MSDKREKTPWWLLYLSPSIIAMAPVLIAVLGVIVALLLPLLAPIRAWFHP
ncbi:MAG: hypothetical protein ACKVP0_05400 [Pirellulaceae bacterium]